MSSIQWDETLINSMLFNYKMRKCPLLKKGQCQYGDDCFDCHNEHTRRRLRQNYNGEWNYGTDKCQIGYMATHQCEYGIKCRNYHTSDELRYHPNEYKTRICNDYQFQQNGQCSRGPICWQFHDESDRRYPRRRGGPRSIEEAMIDRKAPPPQQYRNWLHFKKANQSHQQQQQQQQQQRQLPPHQQQSQQRSARQAPPNSFQQKHLEQENRYNNNNNHQFSNNSQPPHSNPSQAMNHRNGNNHNNNQRQKPQPPPFDDEKKSENRRDIKTQREHDEWLKHMAKWFLLFKTKPCSKGSACPKGINCMEYHGVDDKRRYLKIDDVEMYKAEPCPHIFDYWKTKRFYHNKTCPNGEQCKYAHNYYELGYHQRTYKTQKCPYLTATEMTDAYKIKECPFNRNPDWFYHHFGREKVSKITGNIVKIKDNGSTLRSCLDFCPFYHGEHDRRYPEDPDITYDSKKKQSHSVQDKPVQIDINANLPPHQRRQSYPHDQPQQQHRAPPQYEPSSNSIPPHNAQQDFSSVKAQPSTTSNYGTNTTDYNQNNRGKPGLSQIDIDQHRAEQEEFADQDDW